MQLVINWHITENCNYKCFFCFSEWKNAKEIWPCSADALQIIKEVSTINTNIGNHKFARPTRLNFAGGEPLVLGNKLVEYIRTAKEMGLETSLITNGFLLKKHIEVADSLDMLGISVDSLDESTNMKIGRNCGSKVLSQGELFEVVKSVQQRNPNIKLKFNSVVNKYNWKSTVAKDLQKLLPNKVKILRQLPFKEEKGISDAEFAHFVCQNTSKDQTNVVVEDNEDMINSYLMIDPAGRFFENGNPQEYFYSDPIHKVGIDTAMKQVKFNPEIFKKRY
ncbi:MAG: radical SAM protein [Fibrobacter sp.]|nr:radical SAM protein [Fibrobacter sp.]